MKLLPNKINWGGQLRLISMKDVGRSPAPDEKKEALEEMLAEVRLQEQETRTKELAEKLKLPYINLTILPIESDALILVPPEQARQARLAAFQKIGNLLKIAIENPQQKITQEVLTDLTNKGLEVNIFLASKHSIEKALNRYHDLAQKETVITGRVEITSGLIEELKQKAPDLAALKKIIEAAPQQQASNLLAITIGGAVQNDSSDLHIEAREKKCLLRYRIDGVLHDVVFLSLPTYRLILSRIKLLAGMVLNVHELAQDGRFTILLENTEIEVRASVLPGPNGENIVMRILNPKDINLSLGYLGFRDDMANFLKKEIKRPNGMVITTGPTGSGKTTTLYAFLKEVVSSDIKIITLEDPIEYHLSGITQTQVEAESGYTFAAGLRAILRQDPNIIMLGEIRDKETAEIAIHAALTGHIVFSTLHTNDAAGAIPRFIDMGANPIILSAALIDIMAQRLLRRVCPDCKKEYIADEEQKAKIKKALQGLPEQIATPKISEKLKLYKAPGCAKCNGTGYKGRIGVYENIAVSPKIEKLITKSPSHADVLEVAKKSGFVSMYQDGILKVLEGITTLEELENVVGSSY